MNKGFRAICVLALLVTSTFALAAVNGQIPQAYRDAIEIQNLRDPTPAQLNQSERLLLSIGINNPKDKYFLIGMANLAITKIRTHFDNEPSKWFQEGLKTLNKANTVFPEDYEILTTYSKLYLSVKKEDEAIEFATRAKSIDSKRPEAHLLIQKIENIRTYNAALNLFESYRGKTSDLNRAERLLYSIGDVYPDSPYFLIGMGILAYYRGYLGRDDYTPEALNESFRKLSRASSQHPNFYDGYLYLGYVQNHKKLLNQAMTSANRAIDIDAQDPRAYLLKATILYHQDEIDDSIKVLDQLQSRKDLSIEQKSTLYYWLASNHRYAKRIGEAEMYYQMAVDNQPRDKWALQNYALFCIYETGEYEQAISLINQSLLYDKTNSNYQILAMAYDQKATHIFVETKDARKAIPFFIKSIKANPEYAKAYYGLGVAYSNLGLKTDDNKYFDQAVRILAHANKLDPENKFTVIELEKARERLGE